ncbi:MAG: hypothetical protein CMH62_02595 [Nanoarchaeota archaeon]|nr:hypothetical protein [Nanoarchaeota archaeon]|tara:strand:- start:286 stop:537 length:252 start_codon:yes stop_codon:yes gene_type:complete
MEVSIAFYNNGDCTLDSITKLSDLIGYRFLSITDGVITLGNDSSVCELGHADFDELRKEHYREYIGRTNVEVDSLVTSVLKGV